MSLVRWQGVDVHLTHTVTADRADFDSDRLAPGAHFAHTFLQPGVYRYHCRIHRFMHGEIDAYAVALLGPDRSVRLGSTVTLSGLASADVRSVGLEQEQADGAYEGVASASPAVDGSFSFPITVSGPARFRARAGDRVSDLVAVQPQPLVSMRLRRVDGRAAVAIAAEPDQAGATIALERYIQERYRWMPIRRAKLCTDGSCGTDAAGQGTRRPSSRPSAPRQEWLGRGNEHRDDAALTELGLPSRWRRSQSGVI